MAVAGDSGIPAGTGEGGVPYVHCYGPDPSQYGELYLPDGPSVGVVVVIHGGFWRSTYGAELGAPLARDLAAGGFVAWNLEYRRVGNGGGWPATFEDVAAGIDELAGLGARFGFGAECVVGLGHSAGGQLAAWAGARRKFPRQAPGACPRVNLTGVVSQAGVLDLQAAHELRLSDDAVSRFLGGPPDAVPDRYRFADPMCQLPLDIPFYAVHGIEDTTVPVSMSRNYAAACKSARGQAEFVAVPGGHFELIDPESEAYRRCRYLVRKSAAADVP